MKKLIFLVVAAIISLWLMSFVLSILPAGWMIIPATFTFVPINFYLGFKIGGQLAVLYNESGG